MVKTPVSAGDFVSTLFVHAGHTQGHFFFFFNDTATTEIYTLSLHDALPISVLARDSKIVSISRGFRVRGSMTSTETDRKSTRLNSSHQIISYAVFCLKKKKRRLKKRSTTTISSRPLTTQHVHHHRATASPPP